VEPSLEYRVLGPLEVAVDGVTRSVTGPKRLAVLAALLLHRNRPVPAERLADLLWGDSPPRSAATTLQTFVYQLRTRFGVHALQTTPNGYLLEADDDAVDAVVFERDSALAIARSRTEPSAAAAELDRALARWRGPAYEPVAAEPWVRSEATRLDQLRLEAVEARAAAAIGARRTAGVAASLAADAAANPLRESLWALWALVLAAEGRSAEALRVGTELRQVLGEELGAAPSPGFSAIEDAIVRGEPPPPWPDLGGFGPRAAPGVVAAPAVAGPAPAGGGRRRRRRSVLVGSGRGSPPFVGRESEQADLEELWRVTGMGIPRVVVVSGEPGIGKTRLVERFLADDDRRMAVVLRGRCHEDAAVPYVGILSALAAETDAGGADEADPDRRARMFLSAGRRLLEVADGARTVLVVEDVHWADVATLELVRHLLSVGVEDGTVRRSRLLVLITARPDEVDPSLARALQRLQRSGAATEIALGPLDVAEAAELLRAVAGTHHRADVDELVAMTGGNPLLLGSVAEQLAVDATDRSGGPAAGSEGTGALRGTLDVPTDLDEELWRRIGALGDHDADLLVTAAFLGPEGTVGRLAAVADRRPDDVAAALEVAADLRVVDREGDAWWFDHPQLRRLLYGLPVGADRRARHLVCAERLREVGAPALEVAHHLVRAGDLAPPDVVVRWCADAAEQAAANAAFGVAARHATAAATAAAGALPEGADDGERVEALARLELRAGRLSVVARERGDAQRLLAVASERARRLGLLDVWGRAEIDLARERIVDAQIPAVVSESLTSLDQFLTEAGDRLPRLRAEARALEAELYAAVGDTRSAAVRAEDAEAIAVGEGDRELQAKIGFAWGLRDLVAVDLASAGGRLAPALELADEVADPSVGIWCRSRLAVVAFVQGRLAEAAALAETAAGAARSVMNLPELSLAAAVAAAVAHQRGQPAAVESWAERATRAYEESAYWFTPEVLQPVLAAARVARGDTAGALDALDAWDRSHPGRSRRYRPLVLARAGDLAAARRQLADAPFRPLPVAKQPDLFRLGAVAADLELRVLLGTADEVGGLLRVLADAHDAGVAFTTGWPTFLPEALAAACAATGRADEAAVWSARSLDRVGRPGAVRDGSGAAAPVTAPTVPAPDDRPHRAVVRTLLVTDLVDSTGLNRALGDSGYVELLRVHDATIRRRLAQFDGVEFKHTGDGIAAWFYSASGAAECALALAEDFRSGPGPRLGVRVALAAGEPAEVDGDLFGLAVVRAFRSVGEALPGQVVVTAEVATVAGDGRFVFTPLGGRSLKGFDGVVELLELSPLP
jgi:DNA-binding SARP family transcriptional activator/class 3 adenylate cyclase